MGTKEVLRGGIEAARAGRKAEAWAAFRAVLREDPFNEAALLWLAFLSDDPRASLSYIARALEAHPESPRAHAALRWARQRAAISSPPAPASVRSELPPPAPSRPRRLYRAVAGMALVLGLLLLVVGAVGWDLRGAAHPQP
ncbi:MAG TPA: hypothetical protein ENK56_05245, partial [Chloroflexi bacterium]|nr:hypothetical protein [Chloroflexota bacterium]